MKIKKESPYPYTPQVIDRFFCEHDSFQIRYIKIERSLDDFGHYVCELIIRAKSTEYLLLQGIEFIGKDFSYPPYLESIPSHVRQIIEKHIIERMLRTRVIETKIVDPEFTYTGERVVPCTSPFHAYWIHARRYSFASRWCDGKIVLDAGCGTGYGSQMLRMKAKSCLGLDRDFQAISLARRLFNSSGLDFVVADVTRLPLSAKNRMDVIVALEVLEHLSLQSIELFFQGVRNSLNPDSTFIVSVEDSDREKGVNLHHKSEMALEMFQTMLTDQFPSYRIELFGQNCWSGSYHLDRECRIKPIRKTTKYDTYIAVLQNARLA